MASLWNVISKDGTDGKSEKEVFLVEIAKILYFIITFIPQWVGKFLPFIFIFRIIKEEK